MIILQTKSFKRLVKKAGLKLSDLRMTASQIIDEELKGIPLGAHLFKKRIALPGMGKSGSLRVFYSEKQQRLIFLYLIKKRDQDNIDKAEEEALKIYSKELQKLTAKEILILIKNGDLIEI